MSIYRVFFKDTRVDEDTGEVGRGATSKDWAWECQLPAASLGNEEELPEAAEREQPVREEEKQESVESRKPREENISESVIRCVQCC